MTENKKRKILVIRFSSIGDIVLCSPVLRCLKKLEGSPVEVHFLTKKSFAGFMGNNPYVDKVIAMEKDLRSVMDMLKQEDYDFVVDLHNNLRSLRVKHALGKPSKAFHKLNAQKWLLTRFGINRMPDIHIVDRYMAAAAPLGVVNDQQGLDYFIPPHDEVDLQQLPLPFREGYTGIVIGGTYATKRLPQEKLIALCSKINAPVVLLGGPEDKDTGDAIATEVGELVYNACGRYNLNQSASLTRQARAIISHDTGLMHIAAAFNKPIASVWGNTVPELGMYPYLPKQLHNPSRIFEQKGLSCRPCSKIGYDKCPKKHFYCMEKIQEDAIVGWLNSAEVRSFSA